MADPDFKLADFAKHTRVLFDCMEGVTDAKPAMDRKAARDAIKALGALLGPGEAEDSETPHDPTHGKQEAARGDKARAQDSRASYDTRYSVASIFGDGKHDGEGASPVASVDEIFRREPLGEG